MEVSELSKGTVSDEQDESQKDGMTLTTDKLLVDGHLLRWEQKLIQISNIESVTYWIQKTPKYPAAAEDMRNQGTEKQIFGKHLVEEGRRVTEAGEKSRNISNIQLIIGVVVFSVGANFISIGMDATSALLILGCLVLGILIVLFGVFLLIRGYLSGRKTEKRIIDGNAQVQNGYSLIREGQSLVDEAERLILIYNQDYEKAVKNRYLNIYMASGWQHRIQFQEKKDLKECFEVLSAIFQSGGKSEYHKDWYINIENSTFENGAVLAGHVDSIESSSS